MIDILVGFSDEELMNWRRILAYITGTVDQELLLRNEYLAAENRILKAQIKGRLGFSDHHRRTLAEIGKRLGRKALEDVAAIVQPETILRWYRRLIAKKFDGSKHRRYPGRPRVAKEIENLTVKFARENRSWGYDRIQGALANLGISVSDQTIGNILKRQGLEPAPLRRKGTTWKEFIRMHLNVLTATDFFTAEVLTFKGLVTYYCLFFIHLDSRLVHLAGITPSPDEAWMKQIARNITDAQNGFLWGKRYLLHDRDSKFCESFRQILKDTGVKPLALTARSPNLNSFAERFVRSTKEECVERMILFGEGSLRHALENFVAHYHAERNHQGKENSLLCPSPGDRVGTRDGPIRCRQRLGGLLRFYHRAVG